jgi:hypothetical protein
MLVIVENERQGVFVKATISSSEATISSSEATKSWRL